MKSDRWARIEYFYHATLEREPGERAAFLDEACSGDETLRRQVEALLVCDGQAASFIEVPAVEVAARVMASEAPSPEEVETVENLQFTRWIGAYQLLAPLGRGGMGEVHLALDPRLGRKVAIKVLPAEFTSHPERVRRFAQEARAASALNHPNIITIHEIGAESIETGVTHYIVTEYIEGETLRQRMSKAPEQRMELSDAIDFATQIAAALSAAHKAGIVHRDIKPENVMVRSDRLVKVLDFGLAKLVDQADVAELNSTVNHLTASGIVIGTPRYMSPEQARGERADQRTDIFSLGVMLYEMVAGRAPFVGATASDVMAEILRELPPPLHEYAPDAPPELERIISRALEKERVERYQTVEDLLSDLKEVKQPIDLEAKRGATASGVPPSDLRLRDSSQRSESGTLNIRRPRATVIAVMALVAVLAAAFAGWSYVNRQPTLTEKDTILLADFENKTGDTIFDGTLKLGLATQLQRDYALNVFPDARVRQALAQMERPTDARVTAEIAREMCERQHLKAFITGLIAQLGSRYVITLEALQGGNGEALARAQTEAASKEQVLQALAQATTELCAQLGPGLNAIELPARPLQQNTTSNLEALKAFSECNDLASRGRFVEALTFAKRAAELDPQLSGVYNLLGVISMVTGQPESAAEYHRKAFQLTEERAARQPEQVSEVSKVASLAWYHRTTTGNLTKALEYGLLYRKLAPLNAAAHQDSGTIYIRSGQLELAIPLMQEAIRLSPNFAAPYRGLGEALTRLNRFAEAKETITRALQLHLEFPQYHSQLYELAFIAGDTAGMQQQLDWVKGKPDEYVALDWQTGTAAFAGQWRRAQEFSRQAIKLVAFVENRELPARYATEHAARAAALGDCQGSKANVTQGLAFGRGRIPLARAALALALCGDTKQAQTLANELANRFPEDTVSQAIWLPAIGAAIELRRGGSDDSATQAIEQLQGAARYEAVAEFWPQYLRGQAYLKMRRGKEAGLEFQKILDHRGYEPLSLLYPLAYLNLARAAAITGDRTESRKNYEAFFAAWKEADADLPILREAKRGYELAMR